VDLVLLGPTDLALSGRYAGGLDDPELARTISMAIARIVSAGKVAAIGAADAAAAGKRLQEGVGLVLFNAADMFLEGARSFLRFRATSSGS
jgi:2-keto-3-deoxy-L-rhamnonate aldolase RhmA